MAGFIKAAITFVLSNFSLTFLVIGLLSVPPTVAYIRWRRSGAAPGDAQVAGVRRWLWAETLLFALLPAFAAAMARGYGEFPAR